MVSSAGLILSRIPAELIYPFLTGGGGGVGGLCSALSFKRSYYGQTFLLRGNFYQVFFFYILYTASPENPYFVGELILPYLMANGIFTVTNFHRTFTNKFQL